MAENNGSYIDNNTKIEIDLNSYSKVQNVINLSEINYDAETLIPDHSSVDSSRTYPIKCSDDIDDYKDPNYVPDSIQDSDYDSDSSGSHISELDELDHLEESDNLKTDGALRETINNLENSTLNLSNIQLCESNDIELNSNSEKQNEVSNDSVVSVPTLFDHSSKFTM